MGLAFHRRRHEQRAQTDSQGGDPASPSDVAVKDLSEHLAGIEDREAIEAMQEADDRKSARQHYEARLAELE